MYTKQELIDAFCRARDCQPADLVDMEVTIQKFIDRNRSQIQARLDNIPATAKQQMKQIALQQLAKEAAEQAVIDNDGVSL